jgi:hypothetical protein
MRNYRRQNQVPARGFLGGCFVTNLAVAAASIDSWTKTRHSSCQGIEGQKADVPPAALRTAGTHRSRLRLHMSPADQTIPTADTDVVECAVYDAVQSTPDIQAAVVGNTVVEDTADTAAVDTVADNRRMVVVPGIVVGADDVEEG